MSDAEAIWVLQAAGGDRQAFMALVERHWSRLVAIARSVIGDLEAEDVVQDGLLTAWRKLGGLAEPSAFAPWLTRIVVRRCLKRARKARLLVPLEDAPEVPSADAEPDLDVGRLLAALAPRQRAVMHLTVVEGSTDGEIARALGISAASVRSHRRRARERLRQLVPRRNS